MKTIRRLATSTLAAAALLAAGAAQSVEIDLFDFGLNIDGTTYCALGPCDTDGLSSLGGVSGVDDSSFDYSTGLGVIDVTVGGAGSHSVIGFFDHEIDEDLNGYENETGSVSGSAAAGQSWEIDEPGFAFGDIFGNFLSDTLDNSIYDPVSPPGGADDIAMALAFAFMLDTDETATISFILTQVMPASGLVLTQFDPDSDASIYFAATLDIEGDPGPGPVPEPGTLMLLAAGLLGGLAARRRG